MGALHWLRDREIFDLFAKHQLSRDETKERLTRAILAYGIVGNRRADPKHDLFRLPYVIIGYRGRRWRPDVATIQWGTVRQPEFKIRAPAQWRRIEDDVPVEASAQLLQLLLDGATDAKQGEPQTVEEPQAAEPKPQVIEPPAPARKSSAGRPKEYDWDEGKQFAMRELERDGDPRKPENHMKDWRSQEDLVRRVANHLDDGEGGPDHSVVRRYVPDWLNEFEKRETK